MSEISATELKAKCLGLLDQVAEAGVSYTILKRGRPVARLVPALPNTANYPQLGSLRGAIKIVGDIVSPVVQPEEWNAVRGELFPPKRRGRRPVRRGGK